MAWWLLCPPHALKAVDDLQIEPFPGVGLHREREVVVHRGLHGWQSPGETAEVLKDSSWSIRDTSPTSSKPAQNLNKNQLHVRSQSKTQQIPKSGFHTFPDRSAIKLVIRRRKWMSFVGKTLGRVHWVWRTQDSTWKVLSEAQLSEAQLSGYWQIHVWACFSLLTQNLRLCHKLY